MGTATEEHLTRSCWSTTSAGQGWAVRSQGLAGEGAESPGADVGAWAGAGRPQGRYEQAGMGEPPGYGSSQKLWVYWCKCMYYNFNQACVCLCRCAFVFVQV